ncbi:hypothetical protein F3B47_07225 [Bacteroides fragilis]|jgi:polysaccharide biosynthesis protein|uniref:MATE family efflux transporter n=1 Tax=Bacteroides fragilis TaxID=817 RepID=UPI00044AC6FB|nr:MATE family efflux transporter [Bacteroides fragilis]EXZ90610.1 matE family protein [Bacteroides fragilis str. J38-1]KAA4744822.1 hypothetical protein F3B36_05130 [Bacteroides fragilis]KAA4762962.1 hypothetical protein F3B47_07225 [Bacteroides fragilis]KAA4764782.1 hypothetical protein F3B25_10260 [Bacteroides fragilis]KAA4765542.1 hypothetical protein F3B24_09195 [Bacteroides fragilis]
MSDNKRIAVNTLIIYARMAVTTIISLIATRYVLLELGQADYGLYNVVGGIVTMLNVVSIGMYMTTQRFINVEMGKGPNGNLNKVFNVCIVLHIGFALSIFIIGLTVGLWYIYNILNVLPEKLSDAVLIYFISTTVSAIGIINIPFQGLMLAFEKFKKMAIIDLLSNFMKVPLVILLMCWSGNKLLFYAIGVCFISLFSFLFYYSYCYRKFGDIVKWHLSREKYIYKEILVFNNYTSIGTIAYLSRTQGASVVINYFFGIIVNGAFAIVFQIENFIMMFVNNLGTASDPQITQSYASGNYRDAFSLVEKISKYSMFIMLLVTFSIGVELEFLLRLWLGTLPEGILVLSRWMLVSLLVRSINSSCGSIIQASGHVKWFQIISSVLLLLGLPISWLLYKWGMPPVTIIITFTVTDFISRMIYLWLMHRIIKFDVLHFSKKVFLPVIKVLCLSGLYLYLYNSIMLQTDFMRVMGIGVSCMFYVCLCLFVGMNRLERNSIFFYIKNKI